jgi:hypothetical protein
MPHLSQRNSSEVKSALQRIDKARIILGIGHRWTVKLKFCPPRGGEAVARLTEIVPAGMRNGYAQLQWHT